MKKKYVNTLVALAFLAAMWAGFAYWDKRQSRQPSKTESKPEEKILSLDSSHIQAFTLRPKAGTLKPPEGEAVTCRREGGTWVIAAPKKLPADQATVSTLLNSLTSATVDQVVDPKPANLKDFGLDSPTLTVEVSADAKPNKFTLLLGDETPTSGGIYAQVGGTARVFTLASYLKSSLQRNLFDLRDKRAVTLDTDQIHSIEVEAKGKRYTLTKNPEGVWDLVLPPPVRAERFTVEGLVSSLRGASMQSIVAEDKKNMGKYGFSAPALRLRLSGPGGTQTLVLGQKEKEKDGGRYVAMNSALEPIFTLGTDFLTQFQKDPADLRDKELFSFSSYEAKRVELDTPKGRRVFEKPKERWKQTSPRAKDVTTEKVEGLLNRLRDLRADSFPKGTKLEALGLAKPAYRFKVQFGDKNQTETVEASKVGEHVYARRPTDRVASELSKTALDDIEKALSDL